MNTFREKLDSQSDTLLKCFSLPPVNPHSYQGKDILSSNWGRFVSKNADVDVRADLTLKNSKEVYAPPILGNVAAVSRIRITEALAIANISQFCERLNYACFKHAHKRYGKRINVVSGIEGGNADLRQGVHPYDADKRMHAHLLLQLPPHIFFDAFVKLVRKCWFDTDWGYYETNIEMIKSRYHSAKYNVKTSLDSLDLQNTYFDNRVSCN